jgi:hypothetical protein
MNVYTPLVEQDEARLLVLAPGKRNEQLSGRLQRFRLSRAPTYEALSYVWGDPSKNCVIVLDHYISVSITESLFNALQDLREEHSTRAIWADALCINEPDVEELQQQVTMMREIYSKASRVIAYISPEYDDSSLAIEFAHTLQNVCQSLYPTYPGFNSEGELEEIGLPRISDPRYAALKSLILRDWSSRCWCALEFVSNPELVMVCGKSVFHWDLIPNIIEHCFARHIPACIIPNAMEDPEDRRECVTRLSTLRRYIFQNSAQFSLRSLLEMSHSFQATNPRDKIYAVLGLASDRAAIDVNVDYNCSVESLYTRVATSIMTTSSSLDILYCNFGNKRRNLPSWVPDWST